MLAPFEVPGRINALSTPRHFITCGTNGMQAVPSAPVGIIAMLEITASGIAVTGNTVLFPGLDLLSVSWINELGLLLAVDGVSNTIIGAPWSGPGNALPGSSSFTTLFTAGQLPVLSDWFIATINIPSGIRVWDSTAQIGQEAVFNGSGWVVSDFDVRGSAPATPQ